MLKYVLRSPWFWLGLFIRITALVILPISAPIKNWYAPFLNFFFDNPSIDPWGNWLQNAGDPQAFPYGLGMLLAFAPFASIAKLSGGLISVENAVRLTLAIFDFVLFVTSLKLSKGKAKSAINFYWLSPITIFSIYFLGLNDVIAVCLLMLGVLSLRKSKYYLSGAAVAVAFSIKLSMLLALPVFAILFFKNRSLRNAAASFSIALISTSIVLITPLLATSNAWISTISSNNEAAKVWTVGVYGGEAGSSILLVPLIYVGALYLVWRVRRLNFELFEASLGLVFLAVVLSIQSSPGWYLWTLPLLLSVDTVSRGRTSILFWLFGACFTLLNLDDLLRVVGIETQISPGEMNIFQTLMLSASLLLANKVWRDGVISNDFFVQSKKPFAIGIAGDSGVGKDTLANALGGVFGRHSTTHLSGDDYHLWDRGRPIWQAFTHLNPVANNLTQLERDCVSLISGKSISVRHYNHESGIYEKPTRLSSNDFLIFSGLHTLKLPTLPSLLDLSVFIEMEEGLRKELKIRRDVEIRGHSLEQVEASIVKRAPDVERYIAPQSLKADLVFKLEQSQPTTSMAQNLDRELTLSFQTKLGFDISELRRVLVSIAQVDLEVKVDFESGIEIVKIAGHPSSEEIETSARALAPRVLEFCDSQPEWLKGSIGLMQLVFFVQLEHVLLRRSLS